MNISEIAIGMRFGRLTVIEIGPRKGHRRALVACICGVRKSVQMQHLCSGMVASCGCLRRERAADSHRTHGRSDTAEFRAWAGMLGRCTNTSNSRYSYYGSRGIKVCPRWMIFENFFADMGLRPSPKHSLDRINNSGNYEPGNCRWATRSQQNRNQRRIKLISFGGKSLCISAWADELGIKGRIISDRLRLGWTVEKALSKAI